MTGYPTTSQKPAFIQRISETLAYARDWLDARGRYAWVAATVLGFIVFWPVGLALLAYTIWSKRMFSKKPCDIIQGRGTTLTGNTAFDAYRAETLKRLEDEQAEFTQFLAKLREAKDKAEFDQFMERQNNR